MRSAIIVAHPGHELRVFHWMERNQPLYCCLTEGSGGMASPRLDSTTRLLDSVGAAVGPILGRYPDKDLYRRLLSGDVALFAQLAVELAEALIATGVTVVAGDAVEGFNPVHDVCRFVIDGAVAIVRTRTGQTLQNYDFVLDSGPDSCPESLRDEAVRFCLDDAALDRKIAAALEYPELHDEVHGALDRFGRSAFAVECLRPSTTGLMIEQFERELPAYERYGQIRVDEGRYTEIIRYRQHVLPVRAAIERANRA
jgi:hypothetical protein